MISLIDMLKNAKRRVIFEKALIKRRLKGERPIIPLYTREEKERDPSKSHAKIVPFLIGKNAPTVIVCPGGAYQFVSLNNEGADFARELCKAGYNVFVLIYRTGRNARFPAPMEDLARAISFVKANSEAFEVNADDLYVFGSSAGGHLAAYFAARYKDFETPYNGKTYDLRPKGIVLVYPVISMLEETHEVSRATLLGANCTDAQKCGKSVELIADESYPPTFLWHCEDDAAVPVSNSIRLDRRLTEVGVMHKLNLYPQGGHGIGLGEGTSAEGWMEEAVNFIREI